MKCRNVRRLLSDYIDDCVAFETKAGIERHIKDCPACAGLLQRMSRLVGVVKGEAAPDCSEMYWSGFWPRLKNRIGASAGVQPWFDRVRGLFELRRPVIAFAHAGVLLIAGALVYSFLVPHDWHKESPMERGRTADVMIPRESGSGGYPPELISAFPLRADTYPAARIARSFAPAGDTILYTSRPGGAVDEFILQPVSYDVAPQSYSGTNYILQRAVYPSPAGWTPGMY